MTQIRISHAAELLGVSDDTMRRWISQGRVPAERDAVGKQVIPGAELARLAQELAAEKAGDADTGLHRRSARNALTGLVTKVTSDKVMSQVELQCGPYRIVSLISTEAVNDLGLEVGSIASAVIKSTNVTIEGTNE